MERKITLIKPHESFWHLNLREVWTKKYLLWLFVKRDITVQFKQTIFGMGWYFISPLFSTLIYIIIFSRVAHIPTDGVPEPLFYLSGVCLWNYFSQCISQISTTFEANSGIFGKVYYPRLIAPLSKLFSDLFRFSIQMSLFVVVYIIYGFKGVSVHPNWYLLLFPVLVMLLGVTALGLGLIVTSMTTKYKDLKNFFPVFVSLWMYATPVVYPMSTVTNETLYKIMSLNPLTSVVETFKYAAFGVGTFTWSGLAYSVLCAATLCLVGMLMFKHKERTFIDTI